MGLIQTLLVGRENGIRAKLRRTLGGGSKGGASATSGGSGSGPREPLAPAPAEKALRLQPEAPKDVTPPEGFEVVLHKDALKPGDLTEIIIGGTAIAVYNVDGSFYATANSCPHADGPLGEGSLEGNTVTCPYHGYEYDVTTGACGTVDTLKVKVFDVVVEKTAVCVRI